MLQEDEVQDLAFSSLHLLYADIPGRVFNSFQFIQTERICFLGQVIDRSGL
jgi:hypothetical protein